MKREISVCQTPIAPPILSKIIRMEVVIILGLSHRVTLMSTGSKEKRKYKMAAYFCVLLWLRVYRSGAKRGADFTVWAPEENSGKDGIMEPKARIKHSTTTCREEKDVRETACKQETRYSRLV